MGFLSCNSESTIATCDPYNWDLKKKIPSSGHKLSLKPIKIRHFSYGDLVAATQGFSADSFLGKGSHGSVYRAVLDDGKLIAAVKKTTLLNSSSSVHNHSSQCTNCNSCNNSPVDNEIEILSRVQNPGLVNLIGFCSDAYERKLIVVQFMPNGSLYDLLHSTSRPPGWTRRIRFALQVAKAIQFLHSSSPPVIHRDIKSSNILIDKQWNARLGDFGLALRGRVEDVRVKCTPPAGTLGYLDPGYLAPGDLSTKSDVFSFGILLLEIISGRLAIDLNYSPPSVVDWALPLIKHGEFAGICDLRVGPPADPAVIHKLAVLAAGCVRSTAERRPAMAELVECLRVLRKRAHARPIWNHLRRRVRSAERPGPLIKYDEYDVSEEVMRSSKAGSRRNRKVSSVPVVEYGSEAIDSVVNDRLTKSKSIGSFNEIKVGPDLRFGGNQAAIGGGRAGLAVKMPVVRLSKSRSMGVLRSPRLVNNTRRRGFVYESERDTSSMDIDVSKLVISLDEKSEKEMLEKPLVSMGN